ncbi:C-type lectin domain family 14 member A [Indicator indicator]|uniref:C-type lectin domain family 14 member A n=1 Tax=Indicator indicator TaxID=1002788 RepID=UPI0023DF410A|nr:C-type lectin domain family 14 member A [Indicator indicator]
MPRSVPAPDTFPPAGPGVGLGDGARVGRCERPGPAQAAAERCHSRGGSSRRSTGCVAEMRRTGPWCLLLAAACAQGWLPPLQAALRCQSAGVCFSAHLANRSYAEAGRDCSRRRGSLAWVSSEPELQLLLGLVAEAAAGPALSLVWVGLKRNASVCTDAGHPLRGFSWEGAGSEAAPREVPAALGRWAKEPMRSCITARCAALHLAPTAAPGDGPNWGWKERVCHRESQGYVCKYQYEGACPDISPAGALGLDYRLPFEEHSGSPGFSPPGTMLTVACPGGEVRLSCQPDSGSFAWKEVDEPLCPCPFGCRSPGSRLCADAAGCRDAGGAFACTPGGMYGTPCAATEEAPTAAGGSTELPGAEVEGQRPSAATPSRSPGQRTTAAAGTEKTAVPPPFSSSSNYVFILVTVAVVVLIILVMTVLGVFKLCFNKKSEGHGDKEAPEASSKAEASSAEPNGGAAGGD